MTRQYVTVTLTARVAGSDLVLLDANGKKIAHIKCDAAREANDETIRSIEFRYEWRVAFARMMGQFNNVRTRHEQTPWQAKCGTWITSLRIRRNKDNALAKSCKRKKPSSVYSTARRPNWAAAIALMVYLHNAKAKELQMRADNPWRLWAQTVSGNHRKKGQPHAARPQSDSQAIRRKVVAPTVQVRLDFA